ncbi:lysostaphin resistance A-like protein [uncultured Microbacterium sp.]|uniref:CPBP family intramembrane glutamic endopeptidase n=1 Tax=uncultured Microbacterium sp. TaxID=191216 RepID=UPI0035C9956A
MSEHSSDAAVTLGDPPPVTRSGSRTPRTDWRQGGRTVLRWRETLIALALVSLGIGVLLGALLTAASPSVAGAIAGQVGLWLGMLLPIVWAFTTSRPAGLLRLRWIDLLWGVGFALVLRTLQGWLAVAFGGSGALPTYPLVDGSLSSTWWFTDLVAAAVISPVIEEFFFRAVLMVAIFTVLRRSMGKPLAGVVAVLVTSAVFTLVSVFGESASVDLAVADGILGLVCGTLVVLTGRIWGAVLVHVLYSLSFVVLCLGGTLLG